MRKMTVLIEGSYKVIRLEEPILTGKNPHILLKAYIIWEYYNVSSSKGNYYVYNKRVNKFLGDGYYTFQDLKKIPEGNSGVTLTLSKPEAKCTMVTDSSTTLVLHNNLASLLGFSTRIFLPGSSKKGGLINVNNGLKYLMVLCNVISTSMNLYDGRKSNVLVSLPVTSEQPLFGSTQSFVDIETELEIGKGVISELEFYVTDQDGKLLNGFGSILLELYIQ